MAKKILQNYDFAGNQLIDFRVENLAANPTVGKPGRIILNTSTSVLAYDNGASIVPLLTSSAWADVTGKPTTFPPSSHTHTASEVTDFNASVDSRVIAFIDSTAAADNDIDTLRELMDLIKSNESSLVNLIGRYNTNIGDGSSTSIAVTHNLNSLDVVVEVYNIASGQSVGVGVTRTNANVVTIEAIPAPTINELRVVVKK